MASLLERRYCQMFSTGLISGALQICNPTFSGRFASYTSCPGECRISMPDGLANGHACELPITQAELGDSLGLSTVHVNRSLQELRGKGLITLGGNLLTVKDWEGLKEAGEFDPTYLHLDGDAERAA